MFTVDLRRIDCGLIPIEWNCVNSIEWSRYSSTEFNLGSLDYVNVSINDAYGSLSLSPFFFVYIAMTF